MIQIIDSMPMAEYHANPALGHSGAVVLMERCPAHYAYALTQPEAQKREFDIGTAVHNYVLEPEHFTSRLVIVRGVTKDGRASAGYASQAAKDQRDHAYNNGMTPLLPEEHVGVIQMGQSVLCHPLAGPLLKGGISERTFLWEDEEFQIARKCRPDYITLADDGATVVNFKTDRNAHPEAIRKTLWNNNWFTSEAFTREGLEAHGIKVKQYLYLVVEKEPPYLVAVYQLPRRAVEWGHAWCRKAVETLARCQKTGVWPGYGDAIQEVDPPGWADFRWEERSVAGEFSIKEGA